MEHETLKGKKSYMLKNRSYLKCTDVITRKRSLNIFNNKYNQHNFANDYKFHSFTFFFFLASCIHIGDRNKHK